MTVLLVIVLALLGAMIYAVKLRRIANAAPRLSIATPAHPDTAPAVALSTEAGSRPSVSVVIPAYNERVNIQDCILSVLSSTQPDMIALDVWVIDDQSSDETLAIAQTLQRTLNDPRLNVLAGKPRPDGQIWMGKNWACTQAVSHTAGDFLLFIDADVRLKPGAIAAAVAAVQQQQIDLLTLCPAIVCGCLAEWLIQPWLMSLLIAGLDMNDVNDPQSETAFAAGMFMLFPRSVYEHLGGHQSVASQAVEDVELARRIKQQGRTLRYMIGADLASVRMYQSLAAIWEGWTKNWHLGSGRSWKISLYSALIMVWVCILPWLGLAMLTSHFTIGLTPIDGFTIALGLGAIGLHYHIRQSIEIVTAISPRYWWLSAVSGTLVAAIAITSIIKTETGWGWTWRGRSLKLPEAEMEGVER